MNSELTEQSCHRYQEMTVPRLNRRLRSAAQRNELDTIVYILTSAELKAHPTIDYKDYEAVKYAGYAEQTRVLDYFFSQHLNEKEKAQLSSHLFINGCQTARIKTLDWLIIQPSFQEQPIQSKELLLKKGLYYAIAYGKLKVIEKLLFEYNLPFTITKEELNHNEVFKGNLTKTISDLVDKKILYQNLLLQCDKTNQSIKRAKI